MRKKLFPVAALMGALAACTASTAFGKSKVNPFLAKPPVLRHLKAHIEIQRTFASFDDDHWHMETIPVCSQDVDVPVFDVRHHPKLRPQAESLSLECASFYEKEAVTISVNGRAEVLQPKDMEGWVKGSRDLLRLFFTLDVTAAPESPVVKQLPSLASWELFTGDLKTSQALFRLSPPEFVSITCEDRDRDCHLAGPQSVYRAQVEIKPGADVPSEGDSPSSDIAEPIAD